jgi:hypothetical protein
MAKYTVHLYPVVRVTLDGIEAQNRQEAIDKALDEIDTSCFENLGCNIGFTEEYHDPCLVDVEGDDEHVDSTNHSHIDGLETKTSAM